MTGDEWTVLLIVWIPALLFAIFGILGSFNED